MFFLLYIFPNLIQCCRSLRATIAQLVEQYFRKVEVPGSIPGSGSIVDCSEIESFIVGKK